MFLPVKADFVLPRFPILTILVCLVCVGVFLKQQSDWQEFESAITSFCSEDQSHIERIVYKRISASSGTHSCIEVMYTISNDPERSELQVIEEMASGIKPLAGFDKADSVDYVVLMLQDEVRRYKRLVPDDPDTGLAYYTGSWNPVTMLTSSFAHGDWAHIIFNLIFFFAFAATIEALVGPVKFLLFIVADSFFVGVTGSLAAAATGEHYSTLGLSGIVMGMMGLFAYLLPSGKIKCYYFVVIFFGSVAIPAWLLAAWYIGGDIFALFAYEDHGVVNVMAHVTGGLGGYLFGVALLGDIRKDAIHIQSGVDRADLARRLR